MSGYRPVQAFDLPAECPVDHVTIEHNGDPSGPPFEAIPYNLEGTDDDGCQHYMEPTDFVPTRAYREAVAERAKMDIDDILLEREVPHTDLTDAFR